MESPVQASFIPHEQGAPVISRRPGAGGVADLALMLSILVFASSAALAVGVFLYVQYLNSNAEKKVSELKSIEAQFQPELIAQLQRLDDRMQSAQTILAAHIAPSVFFNLLDQVTAKTVSYTNLKFDASKPDVTLEMDGIAQSINSVAFQDNQLTQAQVAGMPAFQSPIFSNLDHQRDGVHFHMTAVLNKDVLDFGKSLAGQSAVTAPAPAQAAAPVSTPAANAPTSPAAPAVPPQNQ